MPPATVRGAVARSRSAIVWVRGAGGDAGTHGLEVLGRMGLLAYGVLHLLLAALAAQIVWGARRVRADQDAAVALVAGIGPAGAALLAVASAGLVAFGVWQARAALVGFRWTAGGERSRKRIGAAAKAVAMFSVAVIAIPPAIGPLRGPRPADPRPHPQPARAGSATSPARCSTSPSAGCSSASSQRWPSGWRWRWSTRRCSRRSWAT